MSHQENIKLGMQALVVGINNLSAKIGDISQLSTQNKQTLVAVLNELKAGVDAAANSGGAKIDDNSVTATDKVWSINKIKAYMDSALAELVDDAPTALNTLKELAQEIQSNDTQIAAILSSINKRVRFDTAQSLTDAQKQQARDNLDVHSKSRIGNVDFDYKAFVESELS